MTTPIFIANWKMNPASIKEAEKLMKEVDKRALAGQVVVCPPFVFLGQLKAKKVLLAAQDCFWENEGAFTGEISPLMLKNLGCSYVILGHSERKRYLNETTEMIRRKAQAALQAGLMPIICIGADVAREMDLIFEGIENWKLEIRNLILVYEPEWAISSNNGEAASALQAMEGITAIRKKAAELLRETEVFVLYGGSVDSLNVQEFVGQGKADGVLVGSASLDAKEFIELVKKGLVS